MSAQLETETPHLVWVWGLRGSEPQKWNGLDYGIGGWRKNAVRAVYPLTEAEAKLPLDVLARLYPPPDAEEHRHAA